MRIFWLKVAILLSMLFVTSCRHNCEEQCRQQHWKGYRSGEQVGYDRGYDAGHREGYRNGHSKGESEGYDRGHDVGHQEGYRNGYSEGESEGYRSGYLSGTQTYIGDSFFPSLAGSAVFALFIIAFFAFKRFFQKSIGEIVNSIILWLHNAYSYLSLHRKVATLEKYQLNRAEIAAEVSALELFSKLKSQMEGLNYDNEFCLILLKVEQYLIGLNEVSKRESNDRIRRIAEATILAKSMSQGERHELLNMIRIILLSKLSENQNLMKYERASYSKISKKCAGYMKHRKRYEFSRKISKLFIYISIISNICMATGLYLFFLHPSLF